jgi:predicted small secreted protein
MKHSIGFIFTFVLAAALMAGCNSNNNNTVPGAGTNCAGPPAGFQVLYPRDGARRVPTGNAYAVWVAAKPPLVVGNSYDFAPVTSAGALPTTSTFATYTGPIPTPHDTPAPGATVYQTQFLYPIGPLQTVNLYWNDGGTGCNPNVVVSTFTTGQ